MRPCKHVWTVVGRSYHGPANRSVEGTWPFVERLLTGWTDISLRCETCGDVATKQVLGEWKESVSR